MNRDEIIDRLGTEDWRQVVKQFAGLVLAEILVELEVMFPGEANGALAQAISWEVN